MQPQVLWAQREDVLFVTVGVWDMQQESVDCTADQITISGVSGKDQTHHSTTLEFYAPVDPESVKSVKSAGNVTFFIKKAESGAYWPRLLKGKGKNPHWLKTDFARWKDEDEEEVVDNAAAPSAGPSGMGDMDFASMMQSMGGGVPGMPAGMEGMDFSKMASSMGAGEDFTAQDSDDDDDEMPSLAE